MLAPPSYDESSEGGAAEVYVDLTVTSIRSLSLTDLTLSYDLTIQFTWKDSRLTFAHLKVRSKVKKLKNFFFLCLFKADQGENIVSERMQKDIWTPKFYLENESGSKVQSIDFGTTTSLEKKSKAMKDDVERLKEGQ